MGTKIAIVNSEGKKVGDYEFKVVEKVRDDIFKKAVLSEMSLFRQPYGASPGAGRRQVINVHKRRRKFRSTYGKGISRTPRKAMWRRGMQIRFVGAFAPQTVGGRRAHPPKSSKVLFKNINNKEWLKALRIGLSASFDKDIVLKNGQRIPDLYPFIFDDSVEKIFKTSDFEKLLKSLGFEDELNRVSKKKIRAGKGKMRNRTYKKKRGPLVVVSNFEVPLYKASKNICGFEVLTPDLLMVSDFGMSINPGRMVLFTKSAIEELVEVFN